MPSNLGFRIDLSCSIQPQFDPQMTRATEQLLLPPILPLDRELCVAMNRIEQLTAEICTYETYETTIERMEKRLRGTMTHLNARIREISDQIKELEPKWISELNTHEKRIKKRRVQRKRLGDQEQKSGNSDDVKNKKEHNDVKKKDKETEVYDVWGIADNYQKSTSSLGSAVSALDDVIRFSGVLGGKDKTEVWAIQASRNDFLTRSREQLEGQRAVGTHHTSPASTPKAAIQSDPFSTSPLMPASMIRSRSSSSTSLSSAAAANKNTTLTSSIPGSNLVSLDISKTSNNEKTDANQASTSPANSSPAPTTPLTTPPPTPVTTSTPASAVLLKCTSPTESAYVNLPKLDKGGESIRFLPTPNKSSSTTRAEGNKDPKQSGKNNSTLPESQQEASKREGPNQPPVSAKASSSPMPI